ncbi:ketoacyl-ACP synthase III family protein [Streptomyces flaveolus]|uniref:ketoacyl-ACP synthase III family protein n=1 Tax=Streptomyces flaveolus TaxID=67297 RepID=UPI0033FE8845
MRLAQPVGIVSAKLWLPEGREAARDAVRDGRLRPRHARELGHTEVPSAPETAAPDMAVRAATGALREAGVAPGTIGVLLHAWMYYQGHDLWSPAHYVADRLGADEAAPVGVQQVCNGGSSAIAMAAACLAPGTGTLESTDGTRWALVTTADRFCGPGFDRWGSDYGVVYGDAGTAVVLRTPAQSRDALVLLGLSTVAAPGLEAMHRGSDEFGTHPHALRRTVDMRATKRAYLMEHGVESFEQANRAAVRTVTRRALAQAGWKADDPRLRYALLPRFGAKTLAESWHGPLRECVGAELLDLGRHTGHLGAGDAVAGLADLVGSRLLAPGQAALVYSAGAGFTWSCLLVQAPAA